MLYEVITGGNRKGELRTYINLFIVFIVSGLWHGANITFIIWGFLHGIYIVGYNILKKVLKVLSDGYDKEVNRNTAIRIINLLIKPIGVLITFLFVVFAWIFFRANTLSDAIYIVNSIKTGISSGGILTISGQTLSDMGLSNYSLAIILVSILIMELVHLIQELSHRREGLSIKLFNRIPLRITSYNVCYTKLLRSAVI